MKRKTIVVIHILFWIFIAFQTISPEGDYLNDILSLPYLTFHLINILIFYFAYFILSNYLISKDNTAHVLVIIIISIAAVPLFRFFFYNLIMHIAGMGKGSLFSWNAHIFWNNFRIALVYVLYAILIRFAIEWYSGSKKREILTIQNQSSELALLRSQINPHFLFNTLNNIYSLVYTKSEEAPAAVLKLSEIMRYMLNDANADKVPLEKDISYLKSFIELHQLRLNPNYKIEFNIKGSIEDKLIAPMIFITFIENAFKHSDKKAEGIGISINLSVENGKLFFDVANYFKSAGRTNASDDSGLGLNNVKRRLQLIYPGKHTLDITAKDNLYIVKLILEL